MKKYDTSRVDIDDLDNKLSSLQNGGSNIEKVFEAKRRNECVIVYSIDPIKELEQKLKYYKERTSHLENVMWDIAPHGLKFNEETKKYEIAEAVNGQI